MSTSLISKTQGSEAKSSGQVLNVGTRKSKLALIQTDTIVGALTSKWPTSAFEIKARDTAAGDIDKVTPFKDMPVKNIWTHELETLMLEGKLDFLVHALKDVPTQLPDNCEIGGIPAREDPRDAFVLKAGRVPCKIEDLPRGAVIGTSSIRRTAQLALRYPHLQVVDVRGNVPTRLSKLDASDGSFDALLLAAAGLIRLGLKDRITQYLDSSNGNILSAVGQGALGVENRSNDVQVKQMLTSISHVPTFLACTVERSLLRTIEGGCSAPLGVESSWVSDIHGTQSLHLKAIVVSVEGTETAEIDMVRPIENVADAEAFGTDAATEILKNGADRILASIKAKRPTTVTDLAET